MVEVEEIELDLGLSIGGTFRKPIDNPNSKPVLFDLDPRNDHRVDSAHAKPVLREAALRRMEEVKKKLEQKRGVGESEPECEPACKKGKTTGFLDGGVTVSWTTPFCVQQQPYAATVQYVPLSNGLALPCWVANEKNVGGGVDGVKGGDGKAKSNGSSRCSSSAVSDYQCSSREDGGSTDSHSHSANSLAEPTQLNSSKEANIRNQPEESDSSPPVKSQQYGNNVQEEKQSVRQTQSNVVTRPEPVKLREENAENRKTLSMPNSKPLSNENSSNGTLKESKDEILGKPPLPKPLSQASSLPQMPYVSTKGNGPNGRTVNGFLYRYTNSEVSIVCVCHGSTFSPAEFVQHAGGTDITHPLKHITVIPSAFG
ncbi:ninja-family protein 4 [Lotus japonicus]|uniref:ninja-family protein 4 n=1 Tax=Lotus japonicus TaxID=34305 RepID=UPI00258D1F85|nr:ninja-family protein 4 [Lotus japonicus]